jgi:poly-gamma-glutamate synthesis protein (capsule biosynthesis protein)
MTEIARAAIDAGADIVMGHGPHYSLPVELYKGRPIYYGLGNLCFKTGHGGRQHANWVGMLVEITFEKGKCAANNFRFLRHNESYESVFCAPANEAEVLDDLAARSKALGATFTVEDNRVRVAP